MTVTRYGNEGDDKMHDTNARDGLHAGGDDDTIYGHAGALLGGSGGDVLVSGPGNDTIIGDEGVDRISGATARTAQAQGQRG